MKEALEVGLKIEMLDIKDISDTIKTTNNEDVKLVFTNIGGASYNHLRGFARQIDMNGFTTAIDFSTYLSAADVASKGSLKYKLTDRLEKEGVVVSNPVISGSGNCQSENMGGQMQKRNGGKMMNGAFGKSSNSTCGKTGMGNHGKQACGTPVK